MEHQKMLSLINTDFFKSNLCDYNNVYILVRGNITIMWYQVIQVASKCAPFTKCITKVLSTEFERSVYWNKFQTKNENKNAANEYIYFLESNFVGVDRLLVLVYPNQDSNSRSFKTQRYY